MEYLYNREANFSNYYSVNYSKKMSEKLTYKIKLKSNYQKKDGTRSIIAQLFVCGKKKIFNLDLSVAEKHFDAKKQRVKSAHPFYKDYNIIIEKFLGEINQIELNYRLAGIVLTVEKLTAELEQPTSNLDFIKFWEMELERQEGLIKASTLRQQESSKNKLQRFRESILFHEIDQNLFDEITKWLKVTEKNTPNTIAAFQKNFKKYLAIAEQRGIKIPMRSTDIRSIRFSSQRTFLEKDELKKLYEYWKMPFLNDTDKNVLSRFLFSCFTGLRISDIQNLTAENIIENYLVLTVQKTGKFQRITLNESAKKFINSVTVFQGNYTDQYINRTLQDVCKTVGITKKITFHVARHTFATQFLISGGRVEILQKILGHSKIDQTMIYVHIVESIKNEQMYNLDTLLD